MALKSSTYLCPCAKGALTSVHQQLLIYNLDGEAVHRARRRKNRRRVISFSPGISSDIRHLSVFTRQLPLATRLMPRRHGPRPIELHPRPLEEERRLLLTTNTELKAMAAAAKIGLSMVRRGSPGAPAPRKPAPAATWRCDQSLSAHRGRSSCLRNRNPELSHAAASAC